MLKYQANTRDYHPAVIMQPCSVSLPSPSQPLSGSHDWNSVGLNVAHGTVLTIKLSFLSMDSLKHCFIRVLMRVVEDKTKFNNQIFVKMRKNTNLNVENVHFKFFNILIKDDTI